MKLLVAFILILSSSSIWAKPFAVGDEPFDFVGKGLSGDEVRVSDFKGKIVIVSFWASWCAPCRKELPALAGIQKSATPERLQVISINIDEDRRVFKKIADALSDTQLLFISDANKRAYRKYGVEGIPHMLIINAAGKVASVHIGYGEAQFPELIKEINEIARNKPAS
jgi:thiol-disulfide isomerase/thioredoxin